MININKKKLIIYIVMLVISLGIIVFVYNDYFLYKDSIMKVTSVKNEVVSVSESSETYYKQTIKGKIMNGKYINKTLTVENFNTYSGVYDDNIKVNNDLFVELTSDGSKVVSITNIKRDKYIAIMILVFINLIIIVGSIKGVRTIISLVINILLSLLLIFVYNKTKFNILLLFIIASLCFIGLSLYITNGKSKKTWAAIISASISILISFLLAYIVLRIYSNKVQFWFMDYNDAIHDYENLFYVNILLCGLGAIMDIAITMASSFNELIEKNSKISKEALIKSGKEISKDIVGTMTNVMFYTIYTSIIPISILAVRNNMPLSGILNTYGEVEMIRILTSCISIAISIPISLYASLYIFKGGKVK